VRPCGFPTCTPAQKPATRSVSDRRSNWRDAESTERSRSGACSVRVRDAINRRLYNNHCFVLTVIYRVFGFIIFIKKPEPSSIGSGGFCRSPLTPLTTIGSFLGNNLCYYPTVRTAAFNNNIFCLQITNGCFTRKI
jgi:hypothetical protein